MSVLAALRWNPALLRMAALAAAGLWACDSGPVTPAPGDDDPAPGDDDAAPCVPDCGDRCVGDDGCGGECSAACPEVHLCDLDSQRCVPITVQDEGDLGCDASFVIGVGDVWRSEDPDLRETRDLPCLAGDGTLHGRYVRALTTSLDDLAAQLGLETYAADHDFRYDAEDPRANEVEAYYLVTHQAAWVARSLPTSGDFTLPLEVLEEDEIFLDYDLAEVESRQLCSQLLLGMQGLDRAVVNRDVLTHEFGHHVLFAFNREVRNAMIHEGIADYLAAAFTRHSVIEPSTWDGFDRDVDNALVAPEDIITREDYCQRYLDQLVAEGLQARYPAVAQQFLDCLGRPPAELAQPEPHWAGQILAGALWDLRDELGGSVLNPLLFAALATAAVDDTGDLLEALVAADAEQNGGAHESALRAAFAARGIELNLDLDFPELPYHACP